MMKNVDDNDDVGGHKHEREHVENKKGDKFSTFFLTTFVRKNKNNMKFVLNYKNLTKKKKNKNC